MTRPRGGEEEEEGWGAQAAERGAQAAESGYGEGCAGGCVGNRLIIL